MQPAYGLSAANIQQLWLIDFQCKAPMSQNSRRTSAATLCIWKFCSRGLVCSAAMQQMNCQTGIMRGAKLCSGLLVRQEGACCPCCCMIGASLNFS